MRRLASPLALAALAALLVPTARAQAVLDVRATCDTWGVSNCQTVPASVFRVDDGGSFYARSILGMGAIPTTGAGERVMWHSFKAAFRAGGVSFEGETYWDDDNVGFYTTAFGYNTLARGNYSFAAGYRARAYNSYDVAMGYLALAQGVGSTAIGYRATADGDYSLALGYRASANGHAGAIVIADGSTTDSLEASAPNQFNVRAAGGYRLFTNGQETTGVTLAPGAGSWQTLSDRNRKEAFEALDAEALLQRIARLPLSTWHYRDTETTDRHVGPMAQDWQALVDGPLGLNTDSTSISTGDFDGVNLAGIQALEARTRLLAAENAVLRAELDRLRADTAALQATAARVARVEEALARLTADAATVMATASPVGGRP